MYTNVYENLPEEAQKIREEVFVKEQGFHDEFDDTDRQAKHLLLFYDRTPVAACRFFRQGGSVLSETGIYQLWRSCSGGGVSACVDV